MAAPVSKKQIDIEVLLQWTYIDELSKRHTSSAEGIWDRLAQNGSLGGINPDPGHGSAQRYAHFGLPHPDAETIEKAVGALESVVVDWKEHYHTIAGDLSALVTINDMANVAVRPRLASGGSGFGKRQLDQIELSEVPKLRDGRLVKAIRAADAPRDVILVNTISTAALVTMYAVRKSRPDWRTDQMRPVRTVARGDTPSIVGECRGKNLYTTGSYCPLIWTPSPIEVVMARADYVAWRQGLVHLSQTLTLIDHIALPPSAEATPWISPEREIPRRTFRQPHVASKVLPLKPQRNRRGLPPKKPKHSKGRSVWLTPGSSS